LRSRILSNYFEPLLTKAIETNAGKKTKLLTIPLPILCHLSKDLKLHYNYIGSDVE
jgi:hypothetical protein